MSVKSAAKRKNGVAITDAAPMVVQPSVVRSASRSLGRKVTAVLLSAAARKHLDFRGPNVTLEAGALILEGILSVSPEHLKFMPPHLRKGQKVKLIVQQ